MGSHLNGRWIKAANIENDKAAFGYIPNTTIAKFDILAPVGAEGTWLLMGKAAATAVATPAAKLFLSITPGSVRTVRSEKVSSKMVSVGAITKVDTSAASVGDPVYLSDTAGGWSLTAGTFRRRIGTVVAASATAGIILFDGNAPGSGIISGTATIPIGADSVTVAMGAFVAGSPAVATVMQAASDATLTHIEHTGWDGSDDLVIEGNANATAAVTVAYVVTP